MEKLKQNLPLIAFTALLTALAFSFAVSRVSLPQAFGGQGVPEITEVASSTATYFGDNYNAGRQVGTTTMLTLEQVFQYEKIGLTLMSIATSSTPTQVGSVYVQPQVSYNADDWVDWTPPILNTSAEDTLTARTIVLPDASTTVLYWTPGNSGTTSVQFVFDNVVGKWMRFQVWATGTTTLRAKGYLQNN